jgi:hypothetical protein
MSSASIGALEGRQDTNSRAPAAVSAFSQKGEGGVRPVEGKTSKAVIGSQLVVAILVVKCCQLPT